MTDNYELVGSIRSALEMIAAHYDDAIEPAKVTSGSRVAGSQEVRMPLAEHSRAERESTFRDLRYWCHFVLDEVKSIDGGSIAESVDGDDFDAMLEFVARWVDRIVSDHYEDALGLETDMSAHGEALKNIVFPPGREWMPIGNCPVTVADADGLSVECGHMVRAYPRSEAVVAWSSDISSFKANREPIKFIKCPGCGTEDTVDWWMSQIVPEGSDTATATEVIAYVAMRANVILHHDQLRKWKSLGHVLGHGKDVKGRTLYSSSAVLAYAKDQTKEEAA